MLPHQVLSARPGYDGKLTNQACLIYQAGKCVHENVDQYDISQQSIQDELSSLSFICKIGTERFKICMQKGAAGFCRVTYSGNWFQGLFGADQENIQFIPVIPYQRIIDSGVKCFSEATYNWDEM